jgi:hypothetical protein
MDRKTVIHSHLNAITSEMLGFIKDNEAYFSDGWVPAAEIKRSLELNFVAVPKENTQYGQKGWLFAILARMLEDNDLVEFKKEGSRSFYRSISGTSWQTILKVGCEGGCITLQGKKVEDAWKFKMATDETALKYIFDEEDLTGELTSESGVVSSLGEALKLIDEYQWVSMYPVEAHAYFAKEIMSALIERLEHPDCPVNRENFDWSRWKEVMYGG